MNMSDTKLSNEFQESINRLREKNEKCIEYSKEHPENINPIIKDRIENINEYCDWFKDPCNFGDIDLIIEDEYEDDLVDAYIFSMDSSSIAWEPITKECKDVNSIQRDADMFGGFPWTSKSYPWPTYKNGKKELYAAPGIQINLTNLKETCSVDLGDGILQVWFTNDFSNEVIIRKIPLQVLNKEDVDKSYYSKEIDMEDNFISATNQPFGEVMDFPGWVVTGWRMLGVDAPSFLSRGQPMIDRLPRELTVLFGAFEDNYGDHENPDNAFIRIDNSSEHFYCYQDAFLAYDKSKNIYSYIGNG